MVVVTVLALTGCTRSPARPVGVDYVVPDRLTTFDEIRIGNVVLGRQAAGPLAPLVAARTFSAPVSVADYGLDRPLTSLTYIRHGLAATVVEIGAPNFDGHGYYARRIGDPRVYLVLRDAVVPALEAAGFTPAPLRDGGPQGS